MSTSLSGREPAKKRVAILISGRGTNMMALVAAARADHYPARIVAVISNRPQAAGVAWAESQAIPTSVIDHTTYETRAQFDADVHKTLLASGAELVVLAGYMRIMTAEFVRNWEGRMINIHPSLLPLFTGLHTHAKAIEAGMKIAGCTVHYVIPELDAGPIIAQAAVPVLPDDTPDSLAARILKVEHQLYPEALALVAGGDARLVDGRVALTAHQDETQTLISLAISSD